MKRHPARPAARRARRGVVIVIAVVAVLLVSLIGAALLRLAVAHQRQVRREHSRLQADWLAEAGLSRAAARLAADPGYSGETWEVPPDDLGGRDAGVVTISIDRDADGAPAATAVAEFPRDTVSRVRATRRVPVGAAARDADRQP